MRIAGKSLFLWFPTLKVTEHVEGLQKKLDGLHQRKSSKQKKKADKKKSEKENTTSQLRPVNENGVLRETGRKRVSDEERLEPTA